MNILITAIGSMSAEAVIQSFRQFNGSTIVGCDIHPFEWLSTSALVDTFYQVPKAYEANFVSTLLQICTENQIEYLVPLTDPEVDILSVNRNTFESLGITVCVSQQEAIETARDKFKLFQHFQNDAEVNSIPTFTLDELLQEPFANPLIAKPKNGRSSEGIYRLNSSRMVESGLIDFSNYIFQPIINGAVFTVDYVRDRFGNDVSIARKELIRTSNGAGLTVQTLEEHVLGSLVSRVAESLGTLGCINMEFIFDGEAYYLMDINPRFSAGVAFSSLTGYDMAKNHLLAFMGEQLTHEGKRAYGIYIKKYSDLRLS